MGKSSSITVAYQHRLDVHAIVCEGVADAVLEFRFSDKIAWTGEATGGTITIDQPELFGGKKREGGVSGDIDLETGLPTQGVNSYLSSLQATPVPAYRGVTGLVFKQFYFGNNPYLKPWSVVVQRIHYQSDGTAQWYDAKAELPSDPICGGATTTSTTDPFDYAGTENGTVTAPSPIPEGTWVAHSGDSGFCIIEPVADASDYPSLTGGGYNNSYFLRIFNGSVSNTYSVVAFIDLEALFGTTSFEATAQLTLDMGRHTGGGINIHGAAAAIFTIPENTSSNIRNPGTSGTNEGSVSIAPASFTDWTAKDTGEVSLTNGQTGLVIKLTGTNRHVFRNMVLTVTGKAATSAVDMNPAHMIRELLTNPRWGLGIPTADLKDFTAVADTLHAEGFGLSWEYDTERIDPIRAIQRILAHIDAELVVDRQFGQFYIKLIRNDYTFGNLDEYGDDDIKSMEFEQERRHEIPNYVSIDYYDRCGRKPTTISQTNPAAARDVGRIISTEYDMSMIHREQLATQVLQRELRTNSSPKYHGKATMARTFYDSANGLPYHPGDVFKFNSTKYSDLNGRAFRLVDIDEGNGFDSEIRITFVEDVFNMDATLSTISPPARPDPVYDIIAQSVPYSLLQEAPYYVLVLQYGDAQAETILSEDPTAGYAHASATSPGAYHLNSTAYLRDNQLSGAAFEEKETVDFGPYGILQYDATPDPADTVWLLSASDFTDGVDVGDFAQIGDEIVRVDAITSTSVTVGRGALDTVPQSHTAGDTIFFNEVYGQVLTQDEFSDGESIDVKLPTRTTTDTQALSEATTLSLTFDSRAIRPYPPGKLQYDGNYYTGSAAAIDFGLDLTWTERNRLTQTTSVIRDFTYGDIADEAGTTYRVDYYAFDAVGNILNSGNPHNTEASVTSPHTISYATATSGMDGSAVTLRVQLTAVRDGYDSWQSPYFDISLAAEGSLTFPQVTLSGTGEVEKTGSGSLTFPQVTLSGSGTVSTP